MNVDRASERSPQPRRGGLTLVPWVLRASAPPGAEVGVLGEIGDWLTARAMIEKEPGLYELALELPEGVYAYKLRVDGAWRLDAACARTRARMGAQNSVLSIGGAPEPLLFAAAPPWVVPADRGGLVVTAALRRGAGESLSVAWREAGEERIAPMERFAGEDEHVVFRARLPASAARVELAFVLADGRRIAREDGAGPFVHDRAASDLPAWWTRAIVYAIFVDRFRGDDDAAWGGDPGRAGAGGTLDGVRRSLAELADLGVTVLYLTPVHVGASCHRYDLTDPFAIDPALGGEDAFARLVDDAHARDLRVVVDFSFSHAGRGFPPYEDVIANGRASSYAAWFQWTGDELRHYGRRKDAPLFDLSSRAVRRMVRDCAAKWAERGIDGLRLDSAAEVPMELAREVRQVLRERRPDAIVVGEVVPAHAWRWRAEGAVDAATDFGFHAILTDLVARRSIDPAEAMRRARATELDRGGASACALRFTSTHDHARFLTIARASGNTRAAPLGALLLLSWPGVPALLYGEEIGLGAASPELAPASVWPDRAPMPWSDAGRDEALRASVREMIRARRGSRALREGELVVLRADERLLVVRRQAGGEVVDVAVNLSDSSAEIELANEERPEMEPLFAIGEVKTRAPRLVLGPFSGAAIARRARAEEESATRLRVLGAPRARDAAMAARATSGVPSPLRIDIALSELCDASCEHCVSRAPEKTRSGTARSLAPYLLDRLRGALGAASWFGFAHGGEPTVAPLFTEALDAIAEERAGAPYVVHVQTNGRTLGGRAAARMVERGVRSIAVSLDGATAATNDAIRTGARFAQVVANVREVVRMRRATGADLRLGLSLVVLAQNVSELVRAVELAADLGLDWIALEELAPVTPFAKRSLVSHDDPRTQYAIARAVLRGKELGLAVVDRTRPREIWRCRLDAKTAELLDADEFAHRVEIHPCRAPWERACVAPNGDVRLGAFSGPVLGNLAAESFAAIWNGAIAEAARSAAPAARLCGDGPIVCLPL